MIHKPSDLADALDNAKELYNSMIDIANQKMQTEIQWLQNNCDNEEALRMYFTNLYNTDNIALYLQCVNQLKACSVDKLREMADVRANVLYNQLCLNNTNRCNVPLKAISEILKMIGK